MPPSCIVLPMRFISLLLEYMMPEYENEEIIINLTQVFSVQNWGLKPNQIKGPPFTDHLKAIYNLDVSVDSKDPKLSQTKEVPKAKILKLKVDSEENNLQNTHLSPTLRHPNPKLILANFTAEADPGNSAPNDSIPS
uniref:Uncharacterized protein n=1 Tax=Tanacetum cinerariifolium TaxID=118510 RepID=A0A699JPH1_TANCI|nr:hypothetical protein [Tanacetum cinerariifolium]